MTHVLEKWSTIDGVWKAIAEQGRALPILDLLYRTAGKLWHPGDLIRIRDTQKLMIVWEAYK